MAEALYGPDGFFVRADAGPAGPLPDQRARLTAVRRRAAAPVRRVDEALGHPATARRGRRRRRPRRAADRAARAAPTDLRRRIRLHRGGGRRRDRPACRRRSAGGSDVPDGRRRAAGRHRVAGQRAARHRRGGRRGPAAAGARRPATGAEIAGRRRPTPPTGSGWPLVADGGCAAGTGSRSAGPGTWPGPTRSPPVRRGCALAVDYGHLRGSTGRRTGRSPASAPGGRCAPGAGRDLRRHGARGDGLRWRSRPGRRTR